MSLPPGFLDLLPAVDEVVQFVGSRHHLSAIEAEDFNGFVRLRLLEDDARVLRAFEGRANIKTYLVTVISRLLVDFRKSLWGTWRPSAGATRLGPTAVLLEELMVRDGLPFDEASVVMQTTHRVEMSREDLLALAHALPVRLPRVIVGEEAASDVVASTGAADASVDLAEHLARVARVETAFARAMSRLKEVDRLIVTLRYVDDLTTPQVARLVHMDLRPLYRRLDELTATLRAAMLADGVTAEDVASVLGHPVATIENVLGRRRWRAVQPRHAN